MQFTDFATAATAAPPPSISVGAILDGVSFLVKPAGFAPHAPSLTDRYRATRKPGIPPLADVYLPEGPGPHPSTILVHGGGWIIGSRSMQPMRFLAGELCRAGRAVVTFDYRLLFRGGRLEQALEDVLDLFDWWEAQAERFDLDPQRMTVAGLSAGATLMLLAAGRTSVRFANVVSVFAVYDFAGLPGRLPRQLCRFLTRSDDPQVWRDHSPIAAPHVPAPMTLLHGTEDRLTPLAQAHAYAALRREAGLPTALHVYEGAPHGFFNHAASPYARRGLSDLLAALG